MADTQRTKLSSWVGGDDDFNLPRVHRSAMSANAVIRARLLCSSCDDSVAAHFAECRYAWKLVCIFHRGQMMPAWTWSRGDFVGPVLGPSTGYVIGIALWLVALWLVVLEAAGASPGSCWQP